MKSCWKLRFSRNTQKHVLWAWTLNIAYKIHRFFGELMRRMNPPSLVFFLGGGVHSLFYLHHFLGGAPKFKKIYINNETQLIPFSQIFISIFFWHGILSPLATPLGGGGGHKNFCLVFYECKYVHYISSYWTVIFVTLSVLLCMHVFSSLICIWYCAVICLSATWTILASTHSIVWFMWHCDINTLDWEHFSESGVLF